MMQPVCARMRFFAVAAGIVLAILVSITRGETVRTIDDRMVSGSIVGFESNALLVLVKPGDKAPTKIPLAEIVEISFLATPPASHLAGRAAKPKVSPLGALGNLLGIPSEPAPGPPDTSGTEAPATPSADANPQAASSEAARAAAEAEAARAAAIARETAARNAALAQTAPPSPAARVTVSPAPVDPKSFPAKPIHGSGPEWVVELAAGDRITASLNEWTGDRVRMAIGSLGEVAIDVPVDRIRAIWSSSASMANKAKDLHQTAEGQDIVFVEKDGDVKPVAGIVAGIDGGFLGLKFEGENRRIKLDRIAGILLAQRETSVEKSLYQTCNLFGGDAISGRIESIDHGALRFKPLFSADDESAHLEIPFKYLTTIDVKNGRLTWVGDLRPSAVLQVPYFDRLMQYRVNQSLTGGPLVLADGPIAHGIAVHTKCTLTYDIGGSFERFRAKVGFQQPEGKAGLAALRVVGDGKFLWQQPELRGDANKPDFVDISVANVRSLSLEADYGTNFDVAGRVVWGDARLVKAAAK